MKKMIAVLMLSLAGAPLLAQKQDGIDSPSMAELRRVAGGLCIPLPPQRPPIGYFFISEEDFGKTVHVKVGDKISVRLKAAAGWSLWRIDIPDSDLFDLLPNRLMPPP